MVEFAAIVPLVTEVLRLVNNLIEDQPPEQRKANALIAWNIAKPLIPPELLSKVQDRLPPTMK